MTRIANFPQPPGRGARDSMAFPNDLVNGSREFYTELTLKQYAAWGGAGQAIPAGSIRLPMPRRIFDNEALLWEEWSAASEVLSAASGAVANYSSALAGTLQFGGNMIGIQQGVALNPWQFMMFKRPAFKEFAFQWSLAPNTQQESETIKRIVNTLKKGALPTPNANVPLGLVMDYPNVLQVKFRPDEYLFKLKPCAIISVQVDYTGAGQSSFFKSGAPTIVNLSLQLKEIELWNTQNYEE